MENISLIDARRMAHSRFEEIAAGVRRVWRESFCEGCISITSPEFERMLSEEIAAAEESFMDRLTAAADDQLDQPLDE